MEEEGSKIKIKKLFLYNVAKELSASDVVYYFGCKYGEVVDLELLHDKPHSSDSLDHNAKCDCLKTGFVLFARSKVAAKVLAETPHTVFDYKNSGMEISPNWQQLDVLLQHSLSLQEKPPSAIFKLDNDCLESIIQYLKTPDRIRLARTCTRFRSVFKPESSELDDIDFSKMTTWEIRDIFMLSGHHFNRFKKYLTQKCNTQMLKYIEEYCTNLKYMDINDTKKLLRSHHSQIFANMNQLEELNLNSCNLEDNDLLALAHLEQLKILDVSSNTKLTGKNMNCLPVSLESLTMTECKRFESKYLAPTCVALTKLKTLDMEHIKTLTNCFEKLIKKGGGNALEEVTLTINPKCDYEYIALLPQLKKCVLQKKMKSKQALRPNVLTWMVEHKAQQLEHLDLRADLTLDSILLINQLIALRSLELDPGCGAGDRELSGISLPQLEEINLHTCGAISDATLLRLVRFCPKLHKLYLFYCARLSRGLFIDIIAHVRQQVQDSEVQRQLPIKMHVARTHHRDNDFQGVLATAEDIIEVFVEMRTSINDNFEVERHYLIREEGPNYQYVEYVP